MTHEQLNIPDHSICNAGVVSWELSHFSLHPKSAHSHDFPYPPAHLSLLHGGSTPECGRWMGGGVRTLQDSEHDTKQPAQKTETWSALLRASMAGRVVSCWGNERKPRQQAPCPGLSAPFLQASASGAQAPLLYATTDLREPHSREEAWGPPLGWAWPWLLPKEN